MSSSAASHRTWPALERRRQQKSTPFSSLPPPSNVFPTIISPHLSSSKKHPPPPPPILPASIFFDFSSPAKSSTTQITTKKLLPPTVSSSNKKCQLPWLGRRFAPMHPLRGSALEWEVRELMSINPLTLFFLGCIPPFLGAVGSIATALVVHNDEISNYNWQCGRARLPSLSRIINLPMERIFWQFTFLFHIPLRIVEIAVGFNRYGQLRCVECTWPRVYTLSRYLYAVLGALELVFLVALSVVGEREFISYHVVFFYAFGGFATGFFITNAVCHSQSLYYLNPYGRISYYIKIVVTVLFVISMPILFGAFVLYWKKCITFMYDVFAIAEYVDVFLTIAYHCCAFFDIRHKVVFSIREAKHSSPINRAEHEEEEKGKNASS